MKKIKYYLTFVLLIAFLISNVYGFPGMGKNNSTAQNTTQTLIKDLNNTTQSDQDIVMVQHLIEVDALQFQSENALFVRETLIFRNTGTKNFSGSLRTWLPDGASNISVARSEMMTGGGFEPLPSDRKGNIISWQDFVEKNSPLPFLYVVEYTIAQEPGGTLSKVQKFSKMLVFPTLINYQYRETAGLPAVIVRVTKPAGSSIKFLDENGDIITPADVSEDGNSVINRFSAPKFKELTVEISKPGVTASAGNYTVYVVLGIVIILVFSYPILRKKSEKLQAFEEKIKTSLKGETREAEEEQVEETEETAGEEEKVEIPGKIKDELDNEKREILSKLKELDKDYSSGNLLDEEYEELRKPYQERLKEITGKSK